MTPSSCMLRVLQHKSVVLLRLSLTCTQAYYCSAACQRKDWPSHKAYYDPDYGLPKGTRGIKESIHNYEETSNPSIEISTDPAMVCTSDEEA